MNYCNHIKTHPKLYLLILIIFMGSLLRLYQIGIVPMGYTWDEAAITYDAWSIAKWHRDQYANFMPLTFKSFGDYKAPLIHYLLAVIFFLFPPDPIYLRLVSAFSGIALIPISYWLSRLLFSPKHHNQLPLITALLIALSPLSIHFSRLGLEANLSISLITLAITLYYSSLKQTPFLKPLSALLFVSSIFTYHSAKITAPLLIVTLIIINRKFIKNHLISTILFFSVLALSLIPISSSLNQGADIRGKQALIIYNSQNQIQINLGTVTKIARNALSHLTLNYWTKGQDSNLRHIVPGFGIIYWSTLPFLIIGLIFLFKKPSTPPASFLIFWLLISLIPSIISTTAPHAIRSSLIIVPSTLIIALGISISISYLNKVNFKLKNAYPIIIFSCIFINTLLFQHYYYLRYASDSALSFQYGYQQLFSLIKEPKRYVDKIIITDYYGQPYIYALLFNRLTAAEFQAGALANFEFRSINWPESAPNRLYVGTPKEIPPQDPLVTDLITIPHTNQVVWVIARTAANE